MYYQSYCRRVDVVEQTQPQRAVTGYAKTRRGINVHYASVNKVLRCNTYCCGTERKQQL